MKEYYVFTVKFKDGSTEKFGCLKKENNVEIDLEEAEQGLIEALKENGIEYYGIVNVSVAYAFDIKEGK